MRTASVFALVASLLVFTGCCSIGGSGGAGCDSTGYGGNAQYFGGGCDSGQCGANFSDNNCGPMCGAYLEGGQTSVAGGCDDCQMGMSMFRGHVANWFSSLTSRPLAGRFAGGAMTGAAMSGCGTDGGYIGGDSCGCDSGPGMIGPCRGLGNMVGCIGCNECGGGNAIGLNHSGSAGPMAGGCSDGSCGLAGAAGGCLQNILASRRGRSIHPYGGEIPHSAQAGGPAAGGAPGGSAPQYAYPYYTTRGPRDFLMMNPPTIGR